MDIPRAKVVAVKWTKTGGRGGDDDNRDELGKGLLLLAKDQSQQRKSVTVEPGREKTEVDEFERVCCVAVGMEWNAKIDERLIEDGDGDAAGVKRVEGDSFRKVDILFYQCNGQEWRKK